VIRRALALVASACGWLAGGFLLSIAVLVLIQVAGRLLGLLLPAADEFAGFCLAASSFLALASTFRAGGHIRVAILLQRFGARQRRWVEFWCLGVAALLAGYFTVFAIEMVWESYLFGDVGQNLIPTPLWIPQIGVALGLGVLCLSLIDALVQVARGRAPAHGAAED
jgi:TRAP-type C4-dicarboxylate transport system permease small subunit